MLGLGVIRESQTLHTLEFWRHACKYRNLERLSLVEKYYGAKREEASKRA